MEDKKPIIEKKEQKITVKKKLDKKVVEKQEDKTEFDEETMKKLKELEKCINENEEPAITNILHHVKFASKVQEDAFNCLPISDRDKEIFLFEHYKLDNGGLW